MPFKQKESGLASAFAAVASRVSTYNATRVTTEVKDAFARAITESEVSELT